MRELTDLIIPVAIGFIMFGIGINLRLKNFKRVFIRPRAILTGLACQMLLLPLVAFILAWMWKLDPVYKAGFVLIAACPGGTASNLITHLLKGRVALSVSLTAFNSFLILFTIPLIVNMGTDAFLGKHQGIELSFQKIFADILWTVIVPVMAGILVNENTKKEFTEKLRTPLKYILPGMLILIFVLAAFSGEGSEQFNLRRDYILFFPALILNVSTILMGYWLPGYWGINHRGRYTIAIEMGLQNSALAIFIANNILQEEQMALVAVVYSSFSFFTTWGLAYILKMRAIYKTD